MKEVIPINQDREASAIKVLDGPIEQYRLGASASVFERVRFRLDGIVVEAHPAEQNTTSERLKALAGTGAPVVAGVFQLHDGRHMLDWLIPPNAHTIAALPIAVRAAKTWKSFWRALQVATVAGLICAYAVYLTVHMTSAWNALSGIIGLVAAIAAFVSSLQIFFSVQTIWQRFSRRRALQLMESVMAKYESASPRTEERLSAGALHER
ncbi:hypothetical protein LT85_1088 [Collimonas arenae]|uniref:Transmembrane protein n=1 Tax=Collimonas arenae TaxID=279058 RepID=A0A0A1F6Z7_9BURK|nr:hypothetical protein [Collimonas arenae]AIY40246.1 hypothetical protein LT85_1088 [Collimonas arenae]